MATANLEQTIKSYLLKEFLPGESPDTLTPTTPLISAGILDSIATVKLVSYLEDHYGVQFDAHEMSVDYLDSVTQISDIIRKKLAAKK